MARDKKMGSLKTAFDFEKNRDHPAYREKKKKSVYLFGRRKGADFTPTEAFRENFDRIFGKRDEPQDFDNGK